jgi:multicomponent K+:H+ antiporter subunit E
MTLFRRLLPHPLLSLTIFALWMVLAPGLTTGQAVLAGLLAVTVPIFTEGLWPERPRVTSLWAAAMFFLKFLFDIVIANVEVARRVLGPIQTLKPAWVEVPLDVDDAFVATILGSVISLTPGTVTCSVDMKRRVLHVHFLHVEDPDASVRVIKDRYEAALKRIFGC